MEYIKNLNDSEKLFLGNAIFAAYKNHTLYFVKNEDCPGLLQDKMKRELVTNFEGILQQHHLKNEKILTALAEKSRILGPFQGVRLERADLFKNYILNEDELFEWLKCLLQDGYIFNGMLTSMVQQNMPANNLFNLDIKLTPKGWEKVEKTKSGYGSKKVFIAMSFGIEDRSEIQGAIERACKSCALDATTVDKEEFEGGITDKIISMINESRLVIADFTQNKHGVYYEAGYAAGIGKSLILTIRDDQEEIENLHFDTRHLNHITWTSYSDLEEKLVNRIKATLL
ncbi:MAG: hypothetical protein VX642_06760 [Bdellovibrionota bacterium]|nr:hypothetical protein [Bdellovibrionota bacterium]